MDVDWLKKKAQAGFRNEEKKGLIEFHGTRLTVKRQCELIGLSRSTAYYIPVENKPSQNEIDIKNTIYHIHYEEERNRWRDG